MKMKAAIYREAFESGVAASLQPLTSLRVLRMRTAEMATGAIKPEA